MRLCSRLLLIGCIFAVSLAGAASPVTCQDYSESRAKFEYFVSVANHDRHSLDVTMRYRSSDGLVLQIPVWNALYQVRDFSQYITGLQAMNARGETLQIAAIDKSSWRVDASGGCTTIRYSIYENTPGPFSAQLNSEHAFLNWAQVLMFAPSERQSPVDLTILDVPNSWAVHDLGLLEEDGHAGRFQLKQPVLYDKLVDSPVEIGPARMMTFIEGGATYRLVVDAAASDYRPIELQEAVRKIVRAEVEWMKDRPFQQYTFLYHFPHAPVGGGMEHSFGTAVTTPAERLKENALAPIGTTAHEFFHLWNVKRIRPQAMEPVDYAHEQYTRSLWFCEGVTSTASEWMLVRAGLADERSYLAHVSALISDYEGRSAHHYQSPEASSLESWLEGRSFYRRPDRSVSYYTSGELIGILLDLRMRQVTQGTKSLRDLFHYLNEEYAKKGRYYPDDRGIQVAVEKVTGSSFESFFQDHVRGTKDLSYDDAFRSVGLKVQPFTVLGADAGFDASVNFTGLPEVISVAPGSAVEAAGVRPGDTLSAIGERTYMGDLSSFLAGHKPGESLTFHFAARNGRTYAVNVTLKSAESPGFALVDLPTLSPEQRAMRAAWIRGDGQNVGQKP